MNKNFKVMALVAFTALILPLHIFAQNATEDLGPLESNMNKSTSGLFGNDVDDYMDVHAYSEVNPEKWFGFITGSALDIGNPTSGLLSAGYARNISSIYLGLWYQGNIVQVTGGSPTKKSSITPTYDAYKELTETTTKTTYEESWMNSSNQIEVLVGVVGHGIKVGFYESFFSNTNDGAPGTPTTVTDYLNGIKDYADETEEFYEKGGYLRPYLGWGSTFKIGSVGDIRPYATLGATFYSEAKVDNTITYTEISGRKVNETYAIGDGYNYGYVKPFAGVGAWLDLASNEESSVATTVGIEYNFGINIYSNDYEGSKLSGDKVKGTVSWANGTYTKGVYQDRTVINNDVTLSIDELSEMSHEIIPTYIVTGEPAENFKLGFSASIPIGISKITSASYEEQRVIADTKYNVNSDRNTYTETITRSAFENFVETGFSIALDLAIGASYNLIPDRFTVNAGVSARPFSFTNTVKTIEVQVVDRVVTEKTTDGLGNVTNQTKTTTLGTTPDEVETTNVWDAFSGNITGGFTFFFNKNVALDFVATWGSDSFNIDVADVNILLTFKF